MKNRIISKQFDIGYNPRRALVESEKNVKPVMMLPDHNQHLEDEHRRDLAEVLFITSYPPRECGIATYSQDLISSLKNKFGQSFAINVCALESGAATYIYPDEVKYILDTSQPQGFQKLATYINESKRIKVILVQHEFGFYDHQRKSFLQLIHSVSKPVIIVFHTVLPHPGELFKSEVRSMVAASESIVVMTNNAEKVLIEDYDIEKQKINVIAHGTHLVKHISKTLLKDKYGLTDNKVLSTFGLLSSGKGIETTLQALPAIIKSCPEVVFLVIGKTHPEVVKTDGEVYRDMLKKTVAELKIEAHVKFINSYLALPELLEYLQLTDIYLFTSRDPNQAVSGTFSYAMSCACPIISTPIPHALEVLSEDTGIIIDFQNSDQLAAKVIHLLSDDSLRKNIGVNTLQKIISSTWENSAIAHAMLLEKVSGHRIDPRYKLPAINLDHIRRMTTDVGIIQFSKINQPDIDSGYTLDDNARALVAMCMHYEVTNDRNDLDFLHTYLSFIELCLQPGGDFLNYVDEEHNFTGQNYSTNLDDANGRAIWALGYLISRKELLPQYLTSKAETLIQKALVRADTMLSTRAMAFTIKGLYYYHRVNNSLSILLLTETLANRLVDMYKHESAENWEWFESYLTYANSILPEAMLCASLITRDLLYKYIARESFAFLLKSIFTEKGIEVISNKNWVRGQEAGHFGEQPIDVAYTIMTLNKFYKVFGDQEYLKKIKIAFNWFLGNNRLHQIVYNPITGGCYDGLEETHVNLNQGAESTVSYLMARLTIENYKDDF